MIVSGYFPPVAFNIPKEPAYGRLVIGKSGGEGNQLLSIPVGDWQEKHTAITVSATNSVTRLIYELSKIIVLERTHYFLALWP